MLRAGLEGYHRCPQQTGEASLGADGAGVGQGGMNTDGLVAVRGQGQVLLCKFL